jgi:hypothetical protein
MKLKNTLPIALASLVLALVASAATPSPRPKPTASAPASPTITKSPAPKAPSTPSEVLPSPSDQEPVVASTPSKNNNPPPKPVLYLLRTEPYSANGKNWIRYRYDVANKAEYPADMFAAAPALPPCGANTNSSRTWVDFFDSTGKRLYGFCALGKPADLGLLWFALEEGVIPPSYVYIELNDRQTNTKYKSNLADTTL